MRCIPVKNQKFYPLNERQAKKVYALTLDEKRYAANIIRRYEIADRLADIVISGEYEISDKLSARDIETILNNYDKKLYDCDNSKLYEDELVRCAEDYSKWIANKNRSYIYTEWPYPFPEKYKKWLICDYEGAGLLQIIIDLSSNIADSVPIIPTKALPENFDLKDHNWIDTPGNCAAIKIYAAKNSIIFESV